MDLCGKWTLREAGSDRLIEATVPGCNYLDLQNADIIKDPFVGLNERESFWVGDKDWIYEREFEIDARDLEAARAYLYFERLDTVCKIALNGREIAQVCNCHISHRFEVKEHLKAGKNKLECYFYSPVKYVLKKQAKERCPINSNGLTGAAHIRKPQCHFGWDWGPSLPVSGIEGEVRLDFKSVAEIVHSKITQTHGESVNVEVALEIDSFDNSAVLAEVTLINPDGFEQSLKKTVECKESFLFEVKNPELWQPNGATERTEQPLYTVKIRLLNGDTVICEQIKRIGLRTIELDRSADAFGKNFRFIVNGNPVFCKGANFIPADSYPTRVTNEIIDRYIKIAVESDFNMLRVWGGGYYGSDYFYEQCDRFGILVWQDFGFACQAYPFFDDGFMKTVKSEIEYNVKRLAHHPSLCLWCGNNEIEVMSAAWFYKAKYKKWTKKFFYDILPKELLRYDEVTPYVAGSPSGDGYMKRLGADGFGDTHLWAVWHGLQSLKYYRKRYTRFCSEFGFESLPDIKTVRQFAKEEDFSLDSAVFKAHQKCNSGNDKIKYYIAENFRIPKKLEDFVYLSQVCQSSCVADATEHWRRNAGRCNGSLYWQFNDCWPVCSWSGLDYNLNYKAVQYDAKRFFGAFTISLEERKKCVRVWLLNDRISPASATVKLRLIDFCGKEYFSKTLSVQIDGCQSKCVGEIALNKFDKNTLRHCVFAAELIDGEKKIVRTLLFDKEKRLNLADTDIDVKARIEDGIAYYTLKSDKYVRKLALYSQQDAPFDDNYFDLLPNEEVVVCQKVSHNATEDDILAGFSYNHVGRVKPAGSAFSDFALRAKVFLKPLNFFNYLYYKYMIR